MVTSLNVNGKDVQLDIRQDTPLLYALRNDLGLNSPKFGCGLAQCGACNVLVDGNPVRSCVMPVASAVGRRIMTLEGLGTRDAPHPLQTAFIKVQAMQCGYCANGMMMSAAALLEKNPNASEEQIRIALSRNLCRCGTHGRILRAISEAARSYRENDLS
ncbi:MAG: (2Fe-2S)-binding protein [Pseudomonadales bacterium]